MELRAIQLEVGGGNSEQLESFQNRELWAEVGDGVNR
jgi:hypothetical protein